MSQDLRLKGTCLLFSGCACAISVVGNYCLLFSLLLMFSMLWLHTGAFNLVLTVGPIGFDEKEREGKNGFK